MVHERIAGIIGAGSTQTAAKDMTVRVGCNRMAYRTTCDVDSSPARVGFVQPVHVADSQRLCGMRGII